MDNVKSTKCYIEEYKVDGGRLGARLREKSTGRKVDLGLTSPEGKQHFLRFLGVAAAKRTELPDLFSRDGKNDCVVVSGDVDFDAPDEIRYFFNEKLSYLFA